MNKIFLTTPVSHLFELKDFREKVIGLSDFLELRDYYDLEHRKAIIYHSELNILAKWDKKDIDKLKTKINLKEISFHILARYQKIELINQQFIGIGEPMTKTEMFSNCKDNIKLIKQIFGDIIILVENINHLGSDVYDEITDAKFISELVNKSNIYLLFDIAHAKITCINKKLDYFNYLDALPMDKCRQIHLSSYSMEGKKAYDTHAEPSKNDYDEYEKLIEKVKPKYVTLEYYKDKKILLNNLILLRSMVDRLNLISKNDWDTDFFEINIGTIKLNNVSKKYIDHVLDIAKNRYKCLYLFSNKEIKFLTEKNFIKCPTKITFSKNIIKSNEKINFNIRSAVKGDIKFLKNISKNLYVHSRFYTDKNFNNSKCDELYQKWVENSVLGFADNVFVVEENDVILGYITIHEKNIPTIGLIGVSKKARGKKVGTVLINYLQNYLYDKNYKELQVPTQETNIPAINFYKKLGFKLIKKEYIYHRWL
jgi:uncharacterized protein (UPF0276 family)/GNAT superfamily N-acetyltransferase